MKELQPVLEKHRQFLERRWYEAHKSWDSTNIPNVLSLHMCRYTCIFLKKIFETEHNISSDIMTGCPSFELNGTPSGQFGFQDEKRNWHDHSWLVINNKIIDITADQFGFPPIIITDLNDQRYKCSDDQIIFENTFEKLSDKADKWILKYQHSKLKSA